MTLSLGERCKGTASPASLEVEVEVDVLELDEVLDEVDVLLEVLEELLVEVEMLVELLHLIWSCSRTGAYNHTLRVRKQIDRRTKYTPFCSLAFSFFFFFLSFVSLCLSSSHTHLFCTIHCHGLTLTYAHCPCPTCVCDDSLIPYTYHPLVIEAAVQAKKNFVSTSYVSPVMAGFDARYVHVHPFQKLLCDTYSLAPIESTNSGRRRRDTISKIPNETTT